MVTASFDYEKGILKSTFEGVVSLKEIIDYINATKDNTTYPRVLKILTDATKAEMNFNPEDLPLIVEANYKSIEKYDYIIDAIVLDAPKETALSLLYQKLAETKKYKFQIFSTQNAALNWLESMNFKSKSFQEY